MPHKRIVTLIRLPLTLCFLFLMALPAHAAEGATFTVDSGGIGISITQPWSLSTSAVRDEHNILGTNLPTKRITPLGVQQTTVGKFPASLTRVRVVVEDENDKPILVELRDIPLGDTTVTIATRHADTLSEKDRKELGKELEALYASFTWTP